MSAALGALVAAVIIVVALWPSSPSAAAPEPRAAFTALAVGQRAPQIVLADAASGGSRTEIWAPGALTLVSFLVTQPDSTGTASRSQAVELVSLSSQYAAKGLRVVIVDDTPAPAAANALADTAYDWRLAAIPLLADPGHVAAGRYGITGAPTALLVGRDGTVLARWNGYVLTAVAAQTIGAALAKDSVS